MTNIQAAVGCAQLERVDKLVEKKRYIRRKYREMIKEQGVEARHFGSQFTTKSLTVKQLKQIH